MNTHKQVALPTTLTDLLLARENALRLIEDSRRTFAMAEDVLKPYGHHLMPFSAQPSETLERVRQDLDINLWTRAMDLTGFKQLMDAQEVKKFEDSVSSKPPEFTESNIRATFIDLQLKADSMFRRGVYNVFRLLSDAYRTNASEPFRIGPKIIMRSMVRPSMRRGLCINDSMNNFAADRINDIDRVMKTLDKKRFDPRSLECAMNAAFQDMAVFEDEYYRAKAFMNGNLHLQFKRLDLLDGVNEQIAEYYAYGAIPDARAA